jgi:hypothetical protein
MTSKIKLFSLLSVCCIWLAGCAAEAKLGKADITGFHAANATVLVEYELAADPGLTTEEFTEQKQQRLTETHTLLQQYGFRPVTSGPADFRIRINESAVIETTGDWQGAVGANVVLFTLGVVPAMFSYRADFHYELWAAQQKLHSIATPAEWEEAVGLISVSSTLSGADAARFNARNNAHDSVFRLWIEQGSFE